MSLNNVSQIASQISTTMTYGVSSPTAAPYVFIGQGAFNPAVTGNRCFGLYISQTAGMSAVQDDTGTQIISGF